MKGLEEKVFGIPWYAYQITEIKKNTRTNKNRSY